MSEATVVSREERLRRFCVDCPDSVVWKHWSVGGEYPKKLIIKNTHDKLQVIEYKLPKRKATFFVDFPTPVTLSSGMGFELSIKFRPSELVDFHDFIEIGVQGRGSFKISLDALTPFAKLTTLPKHDFEFVSVSGTATKSIPIENSGTVPLDFYWEVPQPFDIHPRMGSLSEGQRMSVDASFHPSEACSMVCRAVCKRAGTHEVLSQLMLSGIGKFAFVSFANGTKKVESTFRGSVEQCVDFGTVLTKSSAQKAVVVQNSCSVDAQFVVKRVDKDIVCPFSITPTKGVITRDGSMKFAVKYSPAGSGAHAANDFIIQTLGGNTLTLRCRGTSAGPTASLSTTKLDFGDVNLDELNDPHATQQQVTQLRTKLDRFVILKNQTDSEINFQFVATNPGAAFAIFPFSGTITAKGSLNIKVSFQPTHPLNYLRRVFLLINDSEHALFLDMIGTAFNTKARPAPFSIGDARAFFTRMEFGLGRCTPDDLAKIIENIRNDTAIESADDAAARQAMQIVLDEKASNKLSSRTVHLEKLLPSEEALSTAPFALDRPQAVFRGFASEGELVMVRNNTGAKATASWSIPTGTPWSVTPESQDIAPFASAAFRVRLSGNIPSASFGCFLECYVNFKQMRSFRLVSQDTFCPPHCLLLQCLRLVALSDTASAPHVDSPLQIAFPPCHEHDSVLQVVSIANRSDTVAAYSLQVEAQKIGGQISVGSHEDPTVLEDVLEQQRAFKLSRVFTCFPTSGVVPPNDTSLLLLKFSPPDTGRFVGVAKLLVNDRPQGSRQIALRGEGFTPTIEVEGNGTFAFRPTSIGGGASTRSVQIRNPSRISVRFEVTVLGGSETFQVSPSGGVIAGCGSSLLELRFSPQQARRYDARIQVLVWAEQPPAGLEDSGPTTVMCHACGEGLIGVVSMEPLELLFGNILVGESKSMQVTVFNSSLCDLAYEMRWTTRNNQNTNGLVESTASPPEFINGKGTIRARSHVNVHVALQPTRGAFEYIVYVVAGGSESGIALLPDPSMDDILRLPHCVCTITGAFPLLQISDTRSVLQPKSHLWRQMSIGDINSQLSSTLTSLDLDRDGFCFEQASSGLSAIPCDLGVDVFRSVPLHILARLDNEGSCSAKFRVWFPDESEVPKEPWHQTKLFSSEVGDIMDAGLFDIQPREGTIEPGNHVVLNFSYKHTRVGKHTLPVMILLEQGKKVLLQLSATTLEEGASFLYFHHAVSHDFVPVAIGDLEPPLQYTELQNLSHETVVYRVDESALQELREKNFDFPIFQCLNPQGVIPPMSTMLLSWYFRPLEAVRYELDLTVAIEGGAVYPLRLGGDGYHPKKVPAIEVRKLHRDKDFLKIPRYPTLVHPSLPVRLSMDVLRFGSIPFHSLHRQIVRITNDHPSDSFVFEWHCVLQYGDQIFDIEPPRGRLQPGESAVCRVTLYSGSTSHVLDNPIHCHILNESLRSRRQCRLEELNREAAMQLDGEPAATPQSTPRRGGGGSLASGPSSIQTAKRGTQPRQPRQPITTIPPKFQSTNRLRETIQAITEAVVSQPVDEESDELVGTDVMPTVLELVVQARIMPVELFHQVYGDAASKAMFFPTHNAFRTRIPPNTIDVSGSDETEWSLVHDVLEDVLKQVVHHELISDAFCDCSEDPVPYFCEVADVVATSSSASKEHDGASAPRRISDFLRDRQNDNEESAEAIEQATAKEDAFLLGGDLHCIVEEILESAVYGIVSDSNTTEGVMNAVIAKRNRSIAATKALLSK